MSGAFPLYYGCNNLEKYFPARSFKRIDINNFEESISIIDQVIGENFDLVNRDYLREAKKLVVNKYNIFPLIVDLIESIEKGECGQNNGRYLFKNTIIPYNSKEFKMKYSSNYILRLKHILKNFKF